MEAEPIQPQIYYCQKCKLETPAIDQKCPTCGTTTQTRSQIKILGRLLLIGGIIVAGFGALCMLVAGGILLFAKNPPKEVSGDAFVLLLGSAPFFVFGVVTIFRGVRQGKYGRS